MLSVCMCACVCVRATYDFDYEPLNVGSVPAALIPTDVGAAPTCLPACLPACPFLITL